LPTDRLISSGYIFPHTFGPPTYTGFTVMR
jgi:hypothetical protein